MRTRRALLLASVLVMGLLASGATARASTLDGAKVAKVEEAGISLRYPATWTVVPLTKKGLAAQVKLLGKKNPKIATQLDAASREALTQQMKFRAQDLTLDGFHSSVGVQAVRASGPSSLDEFTSVVSDEYVKIGATVLNSSAVRVSGKPAYRADVVVTIKLPDGSSASERLGQLIISHGSATAIVTVAADNDATGAQTIDDILGSTRLL